MMKPVDPTKLQCNTRKPGVSLRTSWDGSILHTDPVILTFWMLSNAPEVSHTVDYHLPLWRLRVVVRSKGKHSKYI